MRTRKLNLRFLLGLALGALQYAPAAHAGGPLLLSSPGTPYAWGTSAVDVYTDLGDLGPLANATADALTSSSVAEWSAVSTANFSAAVAGEILVGGTPTDIDMSNAGAIVGTFNGGGIHVIYDDDGTILSNFFGAPPGVLGIASPDFAAGAVITESWAVLNGSAVNPGDPGGASFHGVVTHEFGHTLNLAHTQTNGAMLFFGDDTGPRTCGTPYAGLPSFSDIETMYPFVDTNSPIGVQMATVEHPDDTSALSELYPAVGWPASHGTITGTIFLPDGLTAVTGVNVIARNVANPYADAVSALSGDLTQGQLGPDGLYTLNGLTPGADYVVYTDAIVAGAFSTPLAQPLPGPEEFWNGASESADELTDDVCDATAITAAAGSPATADIVLNLLTTLTLGDDDFVHIPLPFPFPFCGTDYSAVFVGSNGFLTFGAGDTDFIESVADFLTGPPRIAALWDDLTPNMGGTVTVGEVGGEFVVSFDGVPEFFATGSNSFSITLRPDGSFRIDYGTITAADGLVGRTGGGGSLDPGETDLGAEPQPIGTDVETVYEFFSLGGNDLAGLSLEFDPCLSSLSVAKPAQAGVCYATTGKNDGGRLLTLDLTTGAGTLVGPTGLSGVPGLAINSHGEIFGTERVSGDLYRIDAATGFATLVATPGIGFLDAIAFDDNDVLYGVGFDPPSYTLWRIDTATGAATPVGPTGDAITGLAFDPTDGTLYGSTGGFSPVVPDAIYTIDTATGGATLLGTTGLGGATPDLLVVDGMLFGSKGGGGGPNDLIRIDKATGAGTVFGSIGFSSVSGLASFESIVLLALNDVLQSQGVDQLLRVPSLSTGVAELAGTLGENFVESEAMAVLPTSQNLPNSASVRERIFVVDNDRLVELDAGTGNGTAILPGPVGFPDVDGIAFHPHTGVLYGVTYGSNKIIRIDITTGVGTEVAGNVLQGHRPTDLAFHPDGRAFILTDETPSRIYQVDIDTGAKLGRWILSGATSLEALLWSKDGARLYSAADRGLSKDLVTIELSDTAETGTVTFVSAQHSGFLDIEALAWLSTETARTLFSKYESATDVATAPPSRSRLYQNVPNPFNPATRIDFDLPVEDDVEISVFDIRGRKILTLFRGHLEAGRHHVTWTGTSESGKRMPTGIYQYSLKSARGRETRRMLLLK